MKKIIFFISLLVTLSFYAPAMAAVYYVSPSGSDTNPGTMVQPWQHIAYATCGGDIEWCPQVGTNPNKLQAGDTLYVRGGTYYERNIRIDNSGAAGSPITITNYPGETPIVDGGFTNSVIMASGNLPEYSFLINSPGSGYTSGAANVAVTGGSGTGMTVNIGYSASGALQYPSINTLGTGYKLGEVVSVSGGVGGTLKLWDDANEAGVFDLGEGQSYQIINGLNVEHGWKGNVLVGDTYSGHDITIQNCDLHDVIGEDNSGEVFLSHGIGNIVIQDNKFHSAIIAPTQTEVTTNNDNGVFVENNIQTAVIRNNEMYNVNQGIYFKYQQPNLSAPPFVVRNNFIHDMVSSPTYDGESSAIFINNWGTRVTNNLIYNSPSTGISTGASFSCGGHSNGGAFISHNTIVNTAEGVSVAWYSACAAHPPVDNIFRDNIIYNFTDAYQRGVSIWQWDNSYTADQSVTDFDHNLLYSASYSSPIMTNCNRAYCYASLAACTLNVCTNNIGQAPVFYNAGFSQAADFALFPGSPGKNAASDGTDVGADVYGVGIPQPINGRLQMGGPGERMSTSGGGRILIN